MIIAWLSVTALAQDDPSVACDKPYSKIQFGAAIGQVTDALSDHDYADARERLNAMGDRLPCLDEVVDTKLFAKFARYMSTVYFYAQEEDGALRWGLAARTTDPEIRWDDEDFPEGHPLRTLVDNAADPMLGTIGGQGLAPPRGGGVFLSGTWASQPAAHAELPYLVQVFDKDAVRVDSWWQDGSAFPEDILDKPKDLEPPNWWEVDESAVTKVATTTVTRAPDPPPPKRKKDFPWVPVLGSSALLITSGVTYGLAANTASTLPDQRNEKQLTAVRSKANTLVVLSGASLLGAVGFGVAGVF